MFAVSAHVIRDEASKDVRLRCQSPKKLARDRTALSSKKLGRNRCITICKHGCQYNSRQSHKRLFIFESSQHQTARLFLHSPSAHCHTVTKLLLAVNHKGDYARQNQHLGSQYKNLEPPQTLKSCCPLRRLDYETERD